jgi:hypothetical protein
LNEMNLNTHPGLVTKLSLLVALTAGFSMQANATVVLVNNVVVNANASAANGAPDAATLTYVPPLSVNVSASSNADANSAFSFAAGGGLFDNFNTYASAADKGTSTSSYVGKFTVTNELATIQSLSLTSTLDRGRIRMFVTDQLGTANSNMTWELLVNGSVKNSASASLVFNPTAGFSAVQPTNLNSVNFITNGTGFASVSWERTDLFTDLGNLDPGASLDIELRLVANATSAFNSITTNNCYGYGYGASISEVVFNDGVCTQPGGSITTSFGDPGDLESGSSFSAISSVPANVADVPLPGTVALLGLGLIGLGRLRKKSS